MRGIAAREKRYVEVVAVHAEDGQVTPREIVWSDGVRYPIDRVLDCRHAHSLKTGGCGPQKPAGSLLLICYEDCSPEFVNE